MRSRHLTILCLAGSTVIVALLALPLATGEIFSRDDLGHYHYPLKHFYALCLQNGWSFDWIPNLYCGFHLHGEGQLGLYHPLHLALYSLLPLASAFSLELLLPTPVMLAGMALWLRRHHLDWPAACFGGAMFAFSGFSLLHHVHLNAIAVVAHLPWILYGIELALNPRSRKEALVGRLLVGAGTLSQVLLGHPQMLYLQGLIEAPYLLWRRHQLAASWRRLGLLVAVQASGALAGALQLLPTWEAAQLSQRAQAGASFSYDVALHPFDLLQLGSPYLWERRTTGLDLHDMALYCGAVAPILLAWCLLRRRSLGRGWPLAAAGMGLAGLGLVLALGHWGGLYQLVAQLPLLGSFRVPARHILLVHFGCAIFMAVAIQDLWRRAASDDGSPGPPLAWLALPWLLGVSALALFLLFLQQSNLLAVTLGERSPWWLLYGPIALLLATTLVWQARNRRRWAVAALVVLALADLGGYGLSYLLPSRARPAALFSQAGPPPPTGDRLHPGDNRHLLKDRHLSEGYVGLPPARQLSDLGKQLRRPRPAMRVAAVKWVRAPSGERPAWVAMRSPLPRARMASESRITSEPERLLDHIDPARVALVEEHLELEAGPPGTVDIETERPGWLELRTNASGRQLLVVADSFHPGWQARLDGEPVDIQRVYGDFQGVVVPAGEHRVVFEFAAESTARGWRLSVIGLILMVVLAVGPALRWRASPA